jgi:hypothetical protein
VRRAEPGEGGDEVDAVVGLERARERLGLRRVLDDAEPVAQPLHAAPGDEDRALQREGPLAARPAGDGGEQPVREATARSRVEQQEGAGAVGVLPQPGAPAALPEERRLLVARDPRDRHLRAERVPIAVVPYTSLEARTSGSSARGRRRGRAAPSSHAAASQVVEQRARGVGRVGQVQRARR